MSETGRQFVIFLVVGVLATSCHYFILILMVELGGYDPVIASTAGAFAGAILSYGLNRRLTFQSSRAHKAALPRFFAVAALALIVNGALMASFTAGFALAYLPAQIITTVLIIFLTFNANKMWTFKSDHNQ